MTYASGGLIQAEDYNLAAWGTNSGGTYVNTPTNLAYVHGIGFGRYGYGQSTSGYTQVAVQNIVTATQWTNLLNGINASLGLQGASLISPTSVISGGTITHFASVTTGISTAFTNAGTGTVGSRTTSNWTGSGTNFINGTSGWGAGTSRTGRFTITCTWTTADLARYWWNAGGRLELSFSVSPTTGNPRIVDWNSLLTASGTINLGYNTTTKTGGSGTPSILRTGSGGYWLGTEVTASHSGTTTVQYRQFSPNAPYTTDFIQVSTAYSGTASNGGFPVMTITVDMNNAYASTFQQTVDAVPRVTMLVQSPVATALATAPTAPSVTASFSDL